MSGWRQRVGELVGWDNGDNGDVTPPVRKSLAVAAPIVPIVPVVPASPSRVLKHWHAKLSAVDQFEPPDGYTLNDWLQLIDDCYWLYENHASAAVRLGWTEQALFGVRIGRLGIGGVADRLDGGRNLYLTPTVARWSKFGVPTFLQMPDGAGLVSMWEAV